ncbi:hypothetical protein SADUNF_Sadunf15G0045300 [Salix dunnii]|uniref:Uncharacterized protein n=1 Tax=Salix dunnii TaxID=1413687 RepID=A0A835JI91_9ROSI|nr:hypothetical protein SADUNF_Sadunf15G0045300 [Salix dunnii]
MDGNKGFHGMRVLYLPFLLDQYPLVCASCWCRVYPSGFDSNDSYTFPKICPIEVGSLIRLAIGDNWDFTTFLAFSWYTCTHDSSYTASKY